MRIRFAVMLVTLLLARAEARAGPAGWTLVGTDRSSYAMDRDTLVAHAGKSSGRLMNVRESRGFGTMMQCIDQADYAGKRVRFSAYVKARDVSNWAGVWMRIDGPSHSLGFDNMHDRPIKGTRDWARYDVVLDVAKEATGICLGLLLDGDGKVWMSGVTFEVVDTAVPTTGTGDQRPNKPANLGFEH